MIAHRVIASVPECDRRPRIVRIGPIVALFFVPGCIWAQDGRSAEDGGAPADAGAVSMTDPDGGAGAGLDAGAPDASAPDPAADAGAPPPAAESFDSAACFNGLDDDLNEAADCDDDSCGAVPYCCVGSTSAACCTAPGSSSMALDFAACAGSDPAACGGGLTAFGSPAPRVEGGAFVPNGDALDDSGLVLGPPVDPTRERVILRATIAADLDGCTDCLDAVSLGLADPPSTNARVVPDVAVMVRASRRDYALFVAGEAVATAPIPDAAPHAYELEIAPDGAIALRVDGVATMASAGATLRPDRAPLLFGRTHNRDGVHLPARASSVSVATRGCDIPAALAREGRAVIPFPGVEWGARVASSPSAVLDGAERLVAFALDADVHLARRAASGAYALAGSGRVEAPALSAGVNEVLRDPELVREADRFVLYVTRAPADGPATIARALGEDGHAERFGALVDLDLPPDASPAEAPAIADDGGTRWLALRTFHEGAAVIAMLHASDVEGTVFDWARGSLEASIVVAPSEDFARFDHDEVSDPDLVADGVGLLRLFYAGRRGTRWGIGVRVSGDRAVWREPPGAPILAGSSAGHDRLWARHPSALLAGRELELLYTASDGVDLDVGRAVGSAP